MPDDTPAKLGMAWAVAIDKDWFIGKRALERLADAFLVQCVQPAV